MRRAEKISIYQVLVRLFDNPNGTNIPNGTIRENGSGKMDAFTSQALREIRNLGCTHVWYTGIVEHATKSSFEGIPADHPAVVKGQAGSPYAIKDYYDIAPELATDVRMRQEEFDQLVQRTHEERLGVIMDFVPNHVSRTYRSDARPQYLSEFGEHDDRSQRFDRNNNFYYIPGETLKLSFGDNAMGDDIDITYSEYPARATGNDQFHAHPSPNDWYETVKLNYGLDYSTGEGYYYEPVPDTWGKMLDVLLYWAGRGVDGFRCDMVEMVPVEFWQWCIARIRVEYPDLLFVAEVYQSDRYRTFVDAGFDYLYDKVGLYDHLMAVLRWGAPLSAVTQIWQSQEAVKGHLLHFMENHDEVRLAGEIGIGSAERAFVAMALSALIDNGAVMTYFGQEIGERGMESEGYSGLDGRTTIFDYWSLQSMQAWIGKDHSYSGAGLTEAQRALRGRYAQLLNIAIGLKALRAGIFFDLMYANAPLLDARTQFAFLRAKDREVALVVVNFADSSEDVEVFIPRHAFDNLSIAHGQPCIVEDLILGRKGVAELEPDTVQSIRLRPYDVSVYYYTLGDDPLMPNHGGGPYLS